jgi:hypothetical protein
MAFIEANARICVQAFPRATNTHTNTITHSDPETEAVAIQPKKTESPRNVIEMRKPVESASVLEGQMGYVAVSNGSPVCLSPSPVPAPRATAERDVWALAAWLRHPKKANKKAAWLGLFTVYDDPLKRQLFDKNHPLLCKTKNWMKENGRFCPKLDELIANDGYFDTPLSDEQEVGAMEVPLL